MKFITLTNEDGRDLRINLEKLHSYGITLTAEKDYNTIIFVTGYTDFHIKETTVEIDKILEKAGCEIIKKEI